MKDAEEEEVKEEKNNINNDTCMRGHSNAST